MLSVYKYPFDIDDALTSFTIELPPGAEILSVQMQGDQPCIWALVDTDAAKWTSARKEQRRFMLRETGHPISHDDLAGMKFVGTLQVHGGSPLVFHLWASDPGRVAHPNA